METRIKVFSHGMGTSSFIRLYPKSCFIGVTYYSGTFRHDKIRSEIWGD
jgi:hypothetical protein